MTNLSNRVLVYSVSTDAFFNEKENEIAKELMEIRIEKKNTTDQLRVNELNELESSLNLKLNFLIQNKNEGNKRTLRRDYLYTYSKRKEREVNKSNKVVALFESSFTRVLGLRPDEVNESVVIVKAYHYDVLEDLIMNGFKYEHKDYIFFSASSGQMKNKKCVFVRKDLWDKHKGTFLCGLDRERINSTKFTKGDKEECGININKYLAYLSLQNTATTKWEDFDINKVVVCPDLEMQVRDKVEFIDRDTYQISEPEYMTLPMNVSDGVGLILPKLSKKNFQFRIAWGKGLLSSFDFRAFAEQEGKYTITDVWGDTHHIINDDIQIILSASQLKTWKYYKNMDEYRKLFIENKCEAGKCNEEVETNYIHTNYQYLQNLEMTYDELENIATATNYDIQNLGSDLTVMQKSLGATVENEKKNHFQQALLMYPNLLNDSHAKEMIKSKKASMIEDAKAGTLKVEGKRMFVLPDLYGYCDFLFTGNKNPKGLLGKGEVFTKGIKEGTVNIMRSPSLYREHGVRENVKNSTLAKWYKTGAIYVSNRDMLARLLQMDFDGDTVNVCSQGDFVEVTKRNMQNIYPLYYEMSTAPIQKITNESIYKSLELSFATAIGSISNDITKIWNSGEITEEKLAAIKLLTMYNNFMIDYSKTNFLAKPEGEVKKAIKQYTKGKMPYFFQFAKGKARDKVAGKDIIEFGKVYTPVVNMLDEIIKDKRIVFKSIAGKFDYKNLMSVNAFKSKCQELDKVILDTYAKINRTKKWMIDKESEEYKENKYIYVAKVIREDILEAAKEVDNSVTELYVVDALVYYLHKDNKAGNKKTLWESFGDILVANLNYKLNGIKVCQGCSKEFKAENHKEKYCSDQCSVNGEKEKKRMRNKKRRLTA